MCNWEYLVTHVYPLWWEDVSIGKQASTRVDDMDEEFNWHADIMGTSGDEGEKTCLKSTYYTHAKLIEVRARPPAACAVLTPIDVCRMARGTRPRAKGTAPWS